MEKIKGPKFIQFFIPVLDALKELGGSGNPGEVTDLVIENMKISEDEQAEALKNGTSKVRNRIAWARMYLVHAGYIDSTQRGVWKLTEKGLKSKLISSEVYDCFKNVHKRFEKPNKNSKKDNSNLEAIKAESEIEEETNYREELIGILQSIPPQGFERLCQRLLREAGFKQVVVTGRSGDGGIDGNGILQINPFVSFNVIFQCKRYQGSVSASQVRDFRGAMMGRADKGIIITTGTFTTEAKKEASRDGVPPIELVDNDKLIDMFESLELGLKPKKDFEIEESFFNEFNQSN